MTTKPIVRHLIQYNWQEIIRQIAETTGKTYNKDYLYNVWTGSVNSPKLLKIIESIIGKHVRTRKMVEVNS